MAALYDALVPSPVFQVLKVFRLAAMAFSTCSFHHQVSRRQRLGGVVPHTSSVVLSRQVLMLFQISSVAASATPADTLKCKLKTSWKWLLIWGPLSIQTLRRWMNLHLDFGSTSILMSHRRNWCCRATSSLLHLWQVSRLVPDEMAVTFLETCSQEAGWMLGHTLGFSHPQHLVPACQSQCHHALLCIQCLHGLRGHSNLHMGSEIRILGSWQSQHAADQRIGPYPHHLDHSVRHTQTERSTISFTKMILSETLCISKTFSIHSSATNTPTPYTSSNFVISGPVELVPGILALDCAAVAIMVSSLLNTADIHFSAG